MAYHELMTLLTFGTSFSSSDSLAFTPRMVEISFTNRRNSAGGVDTSRS